MNIYLDSFEQRFSNLIISIKSQGSEENKLEKAREEFFGKAKE